MQGFPSIPLQDLQPKEIKGLTDVTQSETQIIWKPCDMVNDLLKNCPFNDSIREVLF